MGLLTRLFTLNDMNGEKVRGQGCAATLILIPFYYHDWFLKFHTEYSVNDISHLINSNVKQTVLVANVNKTFIYTLSLEASIKSILHIMFHSMN